jgi:hypothetical protein
MLEASKPRMKLWTCKKILEEKDRRFEGMFVVAMSE